VSAARPSALEAPVRKATPTGVKTRTSGTDTVDREITALARRLLRRASDDARAYLNGADDAVMLDLEIDGVRCVLIACADHVHHSSLSPREQEIVRMVSQGYPNKTIAAVLEISTWTVSTHLRRIFAKLDVRTRAAMVARALELGVISSPRNLTSGPP
jgi:DNA-binding CsgD family transcriptional regulator